MRTYVYIDWHNLYYGVIKNTPYWWLDISKLIQMNLDPSLKVESIKFFTADLLPRNDNIFAIHRQITFHNALSHYCSNLEIIKGNFIPKTIRVPFPKTTQKFFEYYTFEEKGTDVNLSLQMLNDSWLDLYDCAILVSNDTDFAGVLELVKRQNNKDVGLLTPGKDPATKKLWNLAKFHSRITKKQLEVCQLPKNIPNSTIVKPRR